MFCRTGADPEARLFLNEFFIDYAGAKSNDFLNLLSNLITAGVPIDGVGIQAEVYGGLASSCIAVAACQGKLF